MFFMFHRFDKVLIKALFKTFSLVKTPKDKKKTKSEYLIIARWKTKKKHKTKIGSRENKKKIKKNLKSKGKTNGNKFNKSGRYC